MLAFLSNTSALERGFTLCAIIGGLLLSIRLLLLMIGGDADHGDVHDGSAMESPGDTDADFRFVSLQGIMAFLLIFGLAGRAFLLETAIGNFWSFLAALVSGGIAMWGMGWLFMMMRKLQDSGNVRMEDAVGKKGTVYLTIPDGGSGEVQLVFANKLQIQDAISEDKRMLETGARIVVVGVTGTNTLIVKRDEPSSEEAKST